MIFTENELKKWTLKSQKSQIAILLLNQCSISAVFPIVRFAGDQKTALTGESLYDPQSTGIKAKTLSQMDGCSERYKMISKLGRD